MQDNDTTNRQDRIRYVFYSGLALILALIIIASFNARNPAPPSGWQPQPDPPMVDNSVEVNIFSKNQLFSNNSVCIGSFDEC